MYDNLWFIHWPPACYQPFSIYHDHHFNCSFILTYATVANSAVTGTGVVACLIICAVATATSTSVIAVVGIIAVAGIVAAVSWTIERVAGCYCGRLTAPFTGSTPDAKPKSSSSSPSCACGYQNRACYGTP